MHRMVSPEDLMLQLISFPRQRTGSENSGNVSSDRSDLLQLLLTFDANSDDGSGDDSDTAVDAEDCPS